MSGLEVWMFFESLMVRLVTFAHNFLWGLTAPLSELISDFRTTVLVDDGDLVTWFGDILEWFANKIVVGLGDPSVLDIILSSVALVITLNLLSKFKSLLGK